MSEGVLVRANVPPEILALGLLGLGALVIGALVVGFARRPRLGWALVAIGTLSIAGGIVLALLEAWLFFSEH